MNRAMLHKGLLAGMAVFWVAWLPMTAAAGGIFVETTRLRPASITGEPATTTAFIGTAEKGPVLSPVAIKSMGEFTALFGNPNPQTDPFLGHALDSYFRNGGKQAVIVRIAGAEYASALSALEPLARIGQVAVPGCTDVSVQLAVLSHCEKMRYRLAILDAPFMADTYAAREHALRLLSKGAWGALYHPWIKGSDALTGASVFVPPSGAVAGIFVRTVMERGIWKAPCGIELSFLGVSGLATDIPDAQISSLGPNGVNCMRLLRGRYMIWSANTLAEPSSTWRYIQVRRLGLFIEESITRSLGWTQTEPNGEPLWALIRQYTTNFLLELYRQGALLGALPENAFFVKCDRTTMTTADIASGRVNLIIGIAPVRPAELMIVRVSLKALPVP